MITLRCTKKLLQHLTAKADPVSHEATSALGDWYGNLVFMPDGPPYILVTNERSLLSVVMPHDADLLPALRTRVISLLRRLDIPAPTLEQEVFHLQQIRLGKTRDRRVLGTMNDAAWMLECALRDPPRPTSLEEIEDRLAQVPFSMTNFRYPRDVARELLGAPAQARSTHRAPVTPQTSHGARKEIASVPAELDPEPIPTRALQERSMLVVDIRHWLGKHDDLPTEPAPLRRNALRVARLIEYGGPLEVGHSRETLVECTKRPGRKPCLGLMWVVKTEQHAIYAYCPICKHDEVMISGWEHTIWAEGMMEPVPPEECPPSSRSN